MNPILYEKNTQTFTSNGLGRLSDCISCVVQETINGVFELEMVYPVTGAHYSELQELRIISAIHDDTKERQPFEIYRISRPMNGRVTVNAWHISYMLRKIVCEPFSASSAASAMQGMEDNAIGVMPFTFATDKTTSANLNLKHPIAIKELMGGVQGSVIDVYGGEWEFDNFLCNLKNRRGTDTDVSIRYGKNLIDVTKTTDISNLWTGIIPYWTGEDSDGTDRSVYYDGVIWSTARAAFPYDMVVAIDATSDFQDQPTNSQLGAWGTAYIAANALREIPQSIDVSFVELWQTEEYKNVSALQRLYIGDSVTVKYDALGISGASRIVSYKYNVLAERYNSMTLGDVHSSFGTAIKKDVTRMISNVPTKGMMDQAIAHATDMITGGLGGYVVLKLNANGQPEELLIMDTDDPLTAVNVWRFNSGGLGHSHSGYAGPYDDIALTQDGQVNADMITTGTMLANRILGGTLTLGGALNGNGVQIIKDDAGNEIGRWDKDGIQATKGVSLSGTIYLGYLTQNKQAYTTIDYHSMEMMDKEGNRFFKVGDARDTTGYAHIVDKRIGDGETARFYLFVIANSGTYSVKVNGQSVSNWYYAASSIIFDAAPSDGSEIVFEYDSNSYLSKTYTFGLRASGTSEGGLSSAFGLNTEASGPVSFAKGNETIASGRYSSAEGSETAATGMGSHSEGEETAGAGAYSHSEGSGTTAAGRGSHSEGLRSKSAGEYSHAGGVDTVANGYGSYAIGRGSETDANAGYSMAAGAWCSTVGNYGFATGEHTIANQTQFVCGRYNNTSGTRIWFVVGNGSSDANRSNALTVAENGEGIFSGTLRSNALVVSGTKSRQASTDDYGERLLYSYEMPSPTFGDIGEGIISDDGACYVPVEAIFRETISATQYQVFLQPYGDGACYVEEKAAWGFIVRGTPGLSFGWEIKAKQSGFENLRLDTPINSVETVNEDYGTLADDHINEIKKARAIW